MSSYSIEKDETIEISKNLSIGDLKESLWATTDIETGLKDGESKLQGIGVKDFKQADSCHCYSKNDSGWKEVEEITYDDVKNGIDKDYFESFNINESYIKDLINKAETPANKVYADRECYSFATRNDSISIDSAFDKNTLLPMYLKIIENSNTYVHSEAMKVNYFGDAHEIPDWVNKFINFIVKLFSLHRF